MEIAPDPEGAILSWRMRLENKSGRARRLRLASFCEIAGHETGAYAKDLDFAGMHVETIFVAPAQRHSGAQPASALGARRAGRNLVLRGQAGRECEARRLRGFAHPLHRRRLAPEADRLRAAALAQARRRRQALAVRSRGELHPRGRRSRPAPRRRRSSSSGAPTTRYGRASWSRRGSASRLCPQPSSRSASTKRAPSSLRRRCRRAGRSPSPPTAGG